MSEEHHDLKVMVWNTKICAPRSTFDSKSLYQTKRILFNLILNYTFDFICLIEVDEAVVTHLKRMFNRFYPLYDIANGTQKHGKTRFDTCIIYKKKFVLIPTENGNDCQSTDLSVKGIVSKSGQKYQFLDQEFNNEVLNFVLVHWPSLLTPDIITIRNRTAENLRYHIDEWFKGDEKIIIAGDFNTEPHCTTLYEQLKAFREKESVLRSKSYRYFYNPSWCFNHTLPPCSTLINSEIYGTYFYKNKKEKYWFNFDQVIFSKELLYNQNGWKYQENSLEIFGLFDLTSAETIFDHLPITFNLERH